MTNEKSDDEGKLAVRQPSDEALRQYHFSKANGVTDIAVTDEGILLGLDAQYNRKIKFFGECMSRYLDYEGVPNQMISGGEHIRAVTSDADNYVGRLNVSHIGMSRDFVAPYQLLQVLSHEPPPGLGSSLSLPIISREEAQNAATALGADPREKSPIGDVHAVVCKLDHGAIDRLEMDGRKLRVHMRPKRDAQDFYDSIQIPLKRRHIDSIGSNDYSSGSNDVRRSVAVDIVHAQPALVLRTLGEAGILTSDQVEDALKTFSPLIERLEKIRTRNAEEQDARRAVGPRTSEHLLSAQGADRDKQR